MESGTSVMPETELGFYQTWLMAAEERSEMIDEDKKKRGVQARNNKIH